MSDEYSPMRRPNLQPQQDEPGRYAGARRLFKTVAGPGDTPYPPDESADAVPGKIPVYYAEYLKNVKYEKTVGTQDIQYTGTGVKTYIGNLEPRTYIPEGSICLAFQENGLWFTIDPLPASIDNTSGPCSQCTALTEDSQWAIPIPDLNFEVQSTPTTGIALPDSFTLLPEPLANGSYDFVDYCALTVLGHMVQTGPLDNPTQTFTDLDGNPTTRLALNATATRIRNFCFGAEKVDAGTVILTRPGTNIDDPLIDGCSWYGSMPAYSIARDLPCHPQVGEGTSTPDATTIDFTLFFNGTNWVLIVAEALGAPQVNPFAENALALYVLSAASWDCAGPNVMGRSSVKCFQLADLTQPQWPDTLTLTLVAP